MRKHLQPNKNVDNVVEIKPYDSIAGFLSDFKNVTIWLSNNASQALVSLCSSNKTILECTPVTLAKALKNPVEIQGFKSCHVRDAAALCSYFAWLEKEIPKGKEIDICTKLLGYQGETRVSFCIIVFSKYK